ncbi:vesicle-associated protein 4-1 [Glycine max]|nr:vesicle-associated protein 4-1 [Glycine max]
MAVESDKTGSVGKGWSFCSMPFWQTTHASSTSSTTTFSMHHSVHHQSQILQSLDRSTHQPSTTVSSVAKSLLPTRRRLRLDPPNKLYFPYEPGKQVRSAIAIKNTCKSHVAFKVRCIWLLLFYSYVVGFRKWYLTSNFFYLTHKIKLETNCAYLVWPCWKFRMLPTLIVNHLAVFKFVEPPENNEKPIDQKSRVKFKIMSLKVKGEMDYVPELFDEQRDHVAVEQILRVIFLDPEHPCPALDKLKRLLAEAEAALEARKKPPEETGPRVAGEGLVIDEWKERRERYLARQQVEVVDSV